MKRQRKPCKNILNCMSENNSDKYIDSANRICLVLNAKSLLDTNVAYHSSCYKTFLYTEKNN